MHIAMQAAAGAADGDAPVNSGGTADVDDSDSDGAGERMDRTVAAEQQDRTDNQQQNQNQQQQQASLSPYVVLGECGKRTQLIVQKMRITVDLQREGGMR